MINLSNKVALITGGSRGIGAATSVLFARAGAEIAFTYQKDSKSAENISEQIEGTNRKCLAIKCEISNYDEVKRTVSEVIKAFGKIDILVNNAGIWTYGEIGNMNEEVWEKTIDVNLNSVFYFCNEVVPYMKKQKSGKIINISSTAGQRGESFHSHYATSKGGIISFTKSLGSELAPSGILVNSVAPGWVDTDMCYEVFSDKAYKEQIGKTIPLGRIPLPEDVAGPILFLASDLANAIVGEVLNVNGGSVLCG